jgi:hypothetical protein
MFADRGGRRLPGINKQFGMGHEESARLEIMGILGVLSTHGATLCTEMHLARQFKSRVAIAMPPKEECHDSDTVHLGRGKRCTAVSRFELAIDVKLCRMSGELVQVPAILKSMEFLYNGTSSMSCTGMEGSLIHSIRSSIG